MDKDKKEKPLISLEDLSPREEISGGKNSSKKLFGAFNDDVKKSPPKDRF